MVYIEFAHIYHYIMTIQSKNDMFIFKNNLQNNNNK